MEASPIQELFKSAAPHDFIDAFNTLAMSIHMAMRKQGFWDAEIAMPKVVNDPISNDELHRICTCLTQGGLVSLDSATIAGMVARLQRAERRNDSEMLMLTVTELAEAVEGLRHGNPASDHIPEFSFAEE